MKSPRLRIFALLSLGACAGLLTSCLENSTVVRVREDGSGEIFARYFFSPQMTGMLGMMSGFAADLSGTEGAAAPVAPSAESLLKPSKEDLAEDASSYGLGVHYERHEIVKNASGWDGYMVVYRFDDINTLRIDPTQPPGPLDDLAKSNPAAASALESGAEEIGEVESPVKFTMIDGLLTIDTGFSPETLSEIGEASGGLGGAGSLPGGGGLSAPDGGQIDPAMAMQMAAAMFQGMRIAYFVRIDGEIEETNATYVDGTLITVSDMEPAKMMADPKFMEAVKEAESIAGSGQEPSQAQAEAVIEKIRNVEGFKIETQEQIQVRFK